MPVTTLFVTHDQEEAMELADQIVVISDGRVEQAGTPSDLYDRPVNDFVMNFIGPVTRLDGRLVRPHDVQLLVAPTGPADEAVVERIVRLGFEVDAKVPVHRWEVWERIRANGVVDIPTRGPPVPEA